MQAGTPIENLIPPTRGTAHSVPAKKMWIISFTVDTKRQGQHFLSFIKRNVIIIAITSGYTRVCSETLYEDMSVFSSHNLVSEYPCTSKAANTPGLILFTLFPVIILRESNIHFYSVEY